jgi:WD repeat and SOF domain-containing protein 1
MKIRTISRTEEDFVRKSTKDITKVHINRDPVIHPFEKAREYTRAVVATKLDKIFAKPFVGALDGHRDGVYCMSPIRTNLVPFISGSCDGELRVWDLGSRKCAWNTVAHTGFVRGVAPDVSGFSFFSCGDDKLIKHWALNNEERDSENIQPINCIQSATSLSCIDHHWVDVQFVTGGQVVNVWDESRSQPIHTYQWGADSILSVRYNPAEAALVASTGSDRGVCLYDIRASVPMRKFVLPMNSNKIVWNPREPMNFVLANEDYNLYSFDMRNLSKALMIHKDHVGAVLDVAFSPTGREFVSGSYDRTIRIFRIHEGHSREVYHTKRMQRVFSVAFSADSQYVLSGSDDTNLRIWKAEASKSIGTDNNRAERKKLYLDSLKKRFKHVSEIRRMNKDKKEPKAIKKAKSIAHTQKLSERRKMENVIAHSKPGSVSVKAAREKAVLVEQK